MTTNNSSSSSPNNPSKQRQTALRLLAAFNTMDVEAITSIRHPDCLRYIQPQSMGHRPQSLENTKKVFHALATVFHNYELRLDDLVEDLPQRKICMWLTASGDTDAGRYFNEYVWNLTFDESGEVIVGWREFTDASMKDFFPKLRAAWEDKARRKEAEANGKVVSNAEAAVNGV